MEYPLKDSLTIEAQIKMTEIQKGLSQDLVEVHVRPQLSFEVPFGWSTPGSDLHAWQYRKNEDGVQEATMTILNIEDGGNVRTTLNYEMGRLAGWLHELHYDVKFLRE